MTTNWRGGGFGADVNALFDAGANLARWSIVTHPTNPILLDPVQFQNYVKYVVNDFKVNILPFANDKHRFVIDMHTVPGGWTPDGKFAMFSTQPWAFNCLVETWVWIAREFKDHPYIQAYDLCNEPNCTMDQTDRLMRAIVAGIRTIDTKKRLSVSSANGNPTAFKKIAYFPNDKNIWYTFHMYFNMSFTHQGVAGRPSPVTYKLNKLLLRDYLAEVISFAKRTKSKIYVGEFSASTFAPEPSRIKCISDYITIFEEEGWNWSWHSWREAPVWSCENTQEFFEFMKNKWGKNI